MFCASVFSPAVGKRNKTLTAWHISKPIIGHSSAAWSHFETMLRESSPTSAQGFFYTYQDRQISCETLVFGDQAFQECWHHEHPPDIWNPYSISDIQIFDPPYFKLDVRFQIFGIHACSQNVQVLRCEEQVLSFPLEPLPKQGSKQRTSEYIYIYMLNVF